MRHEKHESGDFSSFTLIALLTLLVSGCAVGPDYVRPTAPLAGQWLHGSESSGDNGEFEHWWTGFNDPTLDSLVRRANDNNLRLQIAALRVVEARVALRTAFRQRWPQQQSINAQALNIELSENTANAALADKAFSTYDAGFDAVWEIDLWGRFHRGEEAASGDYEETLARYHETRILMTAEVARAYVVLRTYESRLEIALRNVLIQEETLRIAEIRRSNGAVTELDVTQARALPGDTKALIPLLRIGIHQSRHAIAVLLGSAPGDVDALLSTRRPIPVAPTVSAGLPLDLLRRRPDIRRAERAAAAQSARIGIAKADLLPRFSILGSIGFTASDASGPIAASADTDDLFRRNSLRFTTGPVLSWPVLNYGRLRNGVRIQDARFEQAALAYQHTVLNAAREVEDALVARLSNQTRAADLLESTRAAQRSVELSLIQYREGSVSYQRVLDTQRFLIQQEGRAAEARGAVALDTVAVYKALGGGWLIDDRPSLPKPLHQRMKQRTNWGDLLEEFSPATSELQP